MILGIRPTIPARSKAKDIGDGSNNGPGDDNDGLDHGNDSGQDNNDDRSEFGNGDLPSGEDNQKPGGAHGGQGEGSKPGADNDVSPKNGELSNPSSQTDLGSSDADPQEDFVTRVTSKSGGNDPLSEDINTISGDAKIIRSNNNTPVQASDIGSASKTDSDVEVDASMSGDTSDSNGFKSAANDSTKRDDIPSPVAVSSKAPGGSQPKVMGATGVQGVNSGQEPISSYSLWGEPKSKSSNTSTSGRSNLYSRKTQSGQSSTKANQFGGKR